MPGFGSIAARDTAVIFITKDGTGAFTGTWPPTGWLAPVDQIHSTTHRVAVLERLRCDAAEGSTVTIGGPSENYTARYELLRGVEGTPRYEVTVGNSTSANPPAIYAPNRLRLLGSTAIGFVTTPTGGGNPDMQSLTDQAWAMPGVETTAGVAWDTYRGSDLGTRTDDWIGLEFASAQSFHNLVFQEGPQYADGGWFTATPVVEIRNGGVWAAVTGQVCSPAYAANNGVHCEIYIFTFAEVTGDAVRIRGTPGGSSTFITAIELAANSNGPKEWGAMCRATGAVGDALPSRTATFTGNGALMSVINDGTRVSAYSAGTAQSFNTYSGTAPGLARATDWFGYWFGGADRSVARLVFQEALQFSDGGAFTTIGAEYYNGSTWVACSNVVCSPTYGANNGIAYDTYTLTFDAVTCKGIRIAGDPFGTANFTTCAELEVFPAVENVPCLFIYYAGIDGDSSASAHPSGWTNTGTTTTTDGTAGNRVGQAYGELTTTTNSVDAAVLTNTSNPWVAISAGFLGIESPSAPPITAHQRLARNIYPRRTRRAA